VGDKDVPEEPFVVPTGGGYFFVPSIWALKRLANPGGAWDRAPAEPNLELAYYKLGRFLYEQAPYGQDIKLTADFYNRLLGEQHRVDAEGLTKDFGLQPLNGQPGPRKFFKTPEELTQDELFQCLWWYFGGQPRRVTKAIRIPYQYRFEGRAALVNTALLVGFEGPGTG
jgi:hypothetical protein